MEYTGERMVPGQSAPITFWEHIYRYRFAARFVRNKRVLDLACGDGYGTAAMVRSSARSVLGIDIALQTCQHARTKYLIDAVCAGGESLPLPPAAFDTVISFETIEHISDPAAFIRECARVLRPAGRLILSTPNREIYSMAGQENPFHRVEFNRQELLALVGAHFARVRAYSQRPHDVSPWSLRSLSADQSRWAKLPGFFRLRSWLIALTCPQIGRPMVRPPDADAVCQTITEKSHPLEFLVNRFAVQAWRRRSGEKPYYWVIVAQKSKGGAG